MNYVTSRILVSHARGFNSLTLHRRLLSEQASCFLKEQELDGASRKEGRGENRYAKIHIKI
jgi:hypothetical protein